MTDSSNERGPMSDHAPIVIRKMLALRRFPILDDVDLREVAVVAENARALTYPAGAAVVSAGAPVDTVTLVLEGELSSPTTPSSWGPHSAFGMLEALAGRDAAAPVIATTDTRVLQLRAFQVEDILEDNFGILSATLRRFASRLARDRHLARPVDLVDTTALGLVERLVLLRQLVPFTDSRLRSLAMVAADAREQTWESHTRVVTAGDRAGELHVILEGTLRMMRDGHVVRELRPGDSFATFETLARSLHELDVETVTAARTLTCSGNTIYDVIEDQTDLGIGILRTCARALLDGTLHTMN